MHIRFIVACWFLLCGSMPGVGSDHVASAEAVVLDGREVADNSINSDEINVGEDGELKQGLSASSLTDDQLSKFLIAANPLLFEGDVPCGRESLTVTLDFKDLRYSIVCNYRIEATDEQMRFGFPLSAGDNTKARFERFSIAIGNSYLIPPEQTDSVSDTIVWNLSGSGAPFSLTIAYDGWLQKNGQDSLADYVWTFRLRDKRYTSLMGDTVVMVVNWVTGSPKSDVTPIISSKYPNGYWFKQLLPSGHYQIDYNRLTARVIPQEGDSVLTFRMGPSWINRRPKSYDFSSLFDVSAPTHGRFQEIVRRYERYKSSPMMIDQYIQSLKAHELFFLRHYIHARHGNRFDDPRITGYFKALSDMDGGWYEMAQKSGVTEPQPYVRSLIRQAKEEENEKKGFPRYDEDYGFIIGIYEHLFRYTPAMREKILRSLTYDEMFFLAHQISARNGYLFNDLSLTQFFEKWQYAEGMIDTGWYDRARGRSFMGLGSEKKAFRDTLMQRVDRMIR